MSEIVFILGAGASKHAGAPLMANFLDKADELRRRARLGEFQADFDRVFNAISALQAVHSKSALDLHNIESVFAAFEMGQLINRLPGMSIEETESLLVSTRRLIFKTLEETITYPVRDGHIYPHDSYNSFTELLNNLNDAGKRSRCSIITFNYDIALDFALACNNCPADYCLSDAKKPGYIPLMKLHGSLNWGSCSECDQIVPWDIPAFLEKRSFASLGRGEYISVHLPLASELSSSALKHCEQEVNPDPVIVPPTWNKTDYHRGLSKVWSRAALELSDAENIFVSGYSLSETDLFFRYLFALGSVGKTLIKRLWVFDPDERVRNRFERLIGQATRPRFRFRNQNFGVLLGTIANDPELKVRHRA